MRKVTRRRIEAALDTLGDLLSEQHEALADGRDRDEISHVRYLLDQIIDSFTAEQEPAPDSEGAT